MVEKVGSYITAEPKILLDVKFFPDFVISGQDRIDRDWLFACGTRNCVGCDWRDFGLKV